MNELLSTSVEVSLRARKNVLLIDARQVVGEMRATILRNRGVDVDFVTQISSARTHWNRNRYDLVLFDFRQDLHLVDQLCEEMKHSNPQQKIAFFVGGPNFWSLTAPRAGMARRAVATPTV
jgi:DNA-binding NtrC family response regulator